MSASLPITHIGLERGLPLNIFLVPLCVLAGPAVPSQYLATASCLRIDGGKAAVIPSKQRFFLDFATAGCGAASAVFFYSAIFAGPESPLRCLVFSSLVIHLLYKFNENCFEEIRRGEASNADMSKRWPLFT